MRRTDLNTLTFGVEIETTIPQPSILRESWGVGGYHCGHAVPGHDGWTTQHDGSIASQYPNVGVEVVSPVLKGIDGLRSVAAMAAKLKSMGAKVNGSTGFHVHIGWNGTTEQLRRLVRFVAYHERALLAATGTHTRDHNRYCASIRTSYRALENMTSEREIVSAGVSRYHVLNLHNLINGRARTVEFRVFAGTLNATKMAAYIQLCLGIVQKALDCPRAPLPWSFDLPARAAGQTPGVFALGDMLCHLNWRKTPRVGRTPAGVLDASQMLPMLKVLRKMAKKYDGGSRRRRVSA
jgi:hypothetical protein